MHKKKLADSIKIVLKEIGEDPNREGLLKTPERVAKSMDYLTNGYGINPSEILKTVKYWPPVARVDNVYGDKNLFCTCPSMDEYEDSAE